MGIRNFNLRRDQIRMMRKISFSGASSLFMFLHHPNDRLENSSVYLPLSKSVAQKLFLGIKSIEEACAPFATPLPTKLRLYYLIPLQNWK